MGTLTSDLIANDHLNTLPAHEYTELINRGVHLAQGQKDQKDSAPVYGASNEKYDAQDWITLATNLKGKSELTSEDKSALKTATDYALATNRNEINKQLAEITNPVTHQNFETLIKRIDIDYQNDDLAKATALYKVTENTRLNIVDLSKAEVNNELVMNYK